MNFNVTLDMTINQIKNIVIKHFYSDDISKNPVNFRLVHLSKFKWLIDDYSITDEKINENDELMLINIRPISIHEDLSEEALKGPNKENEIRKILITLVKASARIVLYSPEAQKFYNILKEKLEARCEPNINPNTVKTLTDMGYSEKKVLRVLHLKRLNIMEALEWLTEHQNDSEDDDDDDYLDSVSIEKGCQSTEKEANLLSLVDCLLKSYHHYRKMDFKPNSKAVQLLLEMGFKKNNITEALKITGNNQINACEWLLGERRHSLQDLDKELDSDNPIYKAIMNDPRIQLNLTNPNMLLVYLSLLETPVSISERIRDLEIGPVLDHIIATYHAEKHAIHMNQYGIDL
ncbi:Ubiquitin-associated domain-containing protein 1 [Eufriesea mexicana]|uniref:Ubiquitin-associated domain-containing protein 1 n=1 Tax=Eufriesea mexicana TaxID=516756 RepID=A0A310SMR5_9HYME|nr:Ubiquitin-associated domain-containing protein 1 [Eufriesea mexicana]